MGGGCGNLCEVGGSCLIKIILGFGRSERGGKIRVWILWYDFSHFFTKLQKTSNIRDKLSLRGRRKEGRGRGEREKCET